MTVNFSDINATVVTSSFKLTKTLQSLRSFSVAALVDIILLIFLILLLINFKFNFTGKVFFLTCAVLSNKLELDFKLQCLYACVKRGATYLSCVTYETTSTPKMFANCNVPLTPLFIFLSCVGGVF